jgi:hypothetical protein
MTKIWTAVAERSGDTAFRTAGCFPKRRGSRPAHTRQLKGLMFKFFEAAWDRRLEALKD